MKLAKQGIVGTDLEETIDGEHYDDDFSNAAEGSDFLPDVADDYDDKCGSSKSGWSLCRSSRRSTNHDE